MSRAVCGTLGKKRNFRIEKQTKFEKLKSNKKWPFFPDGFQTDYLKRLTKP